MTLRRVQRITSVLFLGVSVAYLAGSRSLPLGTPSQPGPGLFPLAVGLLLSAATFTYAIQVFRSKAPAHEGRAFPTADDLRRLQGIVVALVFVGISLPLLGYVASSAILAMAVLRVLGMRGWMRIVLVASLLSVGSFCLFRLVLGVPLPSGGLFLP